MDSISIGRASGQHAARVANGKPVGSWPRINYQFGYLQGLARQLAEMDPWNANYTTQRDLVLGYCDGLDEEYAEIMGDVLGVKP